MGKSLVHGVGINDAEYTVTKVSGKKRVSCQFYTVWQNMLQRCYGEKFKKRRHSYAGCLVCEEWLTFSNFKRWMEAQDWHGKSLDKDLLSGESKLYSPDTCAFIDRSVNNFITDRAALRGDWPIGVSFEKCKGVFRSYCNDPFTGKCKFLGYFKCPNEAHMVWKKRKHEIACQIADLQTDERVANALRLRYL